MKNLITIIIVLLNSCNNTNNELAFIENNKDNDFTIFKNYAVFLRSTNKEGYTFFVSKQEANCSNTYIVPVKKNSEPNIINFNLIDTTCVIDTSGVISLVSEFMKYNICYLEVDSNNVLKVNVDQIAPPDLIRAYDSQLLSEYQRLNWKIISSNWYFKQ